ncbi:hypothetical protein BD413DRAFT_578164, partial [Trametes elegans]
MPDLICFARHSPNPLESFKHMAPAEKNYGKYQPSWHHNLVPRRLGSRTRNSFVPPPFPGWERM